MFGVFGLQEAHCAYCKENERKCLTHYTELEGYEVLTDVDVLKRVCPFENRTMIRREELEMEVFGSGGDWNGVMTQEHIRLMKFLCDEHGMTG